MPRLMIAMLLLGGMSSSGLAAEIPEHVEPTAEISFEKDIRPLFKAACAHCHGEETELSGGLDVRLRRFLLQGGDSGPSIVLGHPEESYLLDRLKSGEMPPSGAGHPMTPAQIDLISRWITASAPTLRSEPESIGQGMVITPEDRAWWAYQPVKQPEIPVVQSSQDVYQPLDAFLLEKLEAAGWQFSPLADRRTLIRRAYFDLLGITPTPEAVEQFVQDDSPEAWERLIDQLLADARFGERWGRHWLDVVGYADSEGVTNLDPERKWAWKYRDYVIDSFNKNKPYDQFVKEQLAGDEMLSPPYKNLAAEDVEKLVATGFLRMAPDGSMANDLDKELARNEMIASTIEIVSSTLLGMTVECAQCHEHRYDPIPQADYYRLRAIFDPALDWKNWRVPSQRLISLYTDDDRAKAAEIEKEAQAILAERKIKEEEYVTRAFEKELEKLPEEERPLAIAARSIPAKDRTPEQAALFKKVPSLNIVPGALYLYDRKASDELKAMADRAAEVRATKPKEEFVRALTEIPGKVPASYVFYRGDHDQPKEQVEPGGLSILDEAIPGRIPVDNPELTTTGRRLAFATYVTDSRNPLTSRVIVNRMWLHLFGRGIVETPADFGRLGALPTHPELLDWLAHDFVQNGWNVKRFLKNVMLSRAYQQALSTNADYLTADPDGALYGSVRLKRVEAEVLRDTILAISGKMNPKTAGPPIPVMSDPVGQWVIGIENLSAGRPGKVIDMKGEDFRRSIYVQVRRSRPLAVLETFDSPRMEPNCEKRTHSTVAPQSLMLMNGDFIMQQAGFFADRLMKEGENDPRKMIPLAWQWVFSRKPTDSELADAEQFLLEQQELITPQSGKKENPKQQALASLCQILLSSNEFLYLD